MSRILTSGVTALMLSTAPAFANGWEAVVIGQPGPKANTSFADAFHMSTALRAGGFETVTMLRDVPVQRVTDALSALAGSQRAVVYFSGSLSEAGDALLLKDGALPVATLLDQLADQGLRQVALLVENCTSGSPEAETLTVPDFPETMSVYLAASAGPEDACSDALRLTGLMQSVAGLDNTSVQESIAGLWFETTLDAPIPLNRANTPSGPSPVVSPVISSVTSATVEAVSPVTSPVRATTPLSPVAPTQVSLRADTSGPATLNRQTVIVAPPSGPQVAAIPRDQGLPQPSIIVGFIAEEDRAAFDVVEPPAEVTSSEITYENLEARRSLKESSPELFETLLNDGAFDPPENLLVVALQTELQRMGCYRARIDGDWGRGSRASVNRYFDEIEGQEAVSQDPTIDLFRQIIRQDDIACPAPVAASRPAATTQRATTTRRQTTTTTRTTRATPAPAPARRAPAASSGGGRQISTGRSLGGVFR